MDTDSQVHKNTSYYLYIFVSYLLGRTPQNSFIVFAVIVIVFLWFRIIAVTVLCAVCRLNAPCGVFL